MLKVCGVNFITMLFTNISFSMFAVSGFKIVLGVNAPNDMVSVKTLEVQTKECLFFFSFSPLDVLDKD